MTYEEWLTHKSYQESLGERNPLSCYNFDKWMVRLEKYNPTVYNLEDFIHKKDFPLLNATSPKWNMTVMTDEQRELTEHLLAKEVEEHTEPSWSVEYT